MRQNIAFVRPYVHEKATKWLQDTCEKHEQSHSSSSRKYHKMICCVKGVSYATKCCDKHNTQSYPKNNCFSRRSRGGETVDLASLLLAVIFKLRGGRCPSGLLSSPSDRGPQDLSHPGDCVPWTLYNIGRLRRPNPLHLGGCAPNPRLRFLITMWHPLIFMCNYQ